MHCVPALRHAVPRSFSATPLLLIHYFAYAQNRSLPPAYHHWRGYHPLSSFSLFCALFPCLCVHLLSVPRFSLCRPSLNFFAHPCKFLSGLRLPPMLPCAQRSWPWFGGRTSASARTSCKKRPSVVTQGRLACLFHGHLHRLASHSVMMTRVEMWKKRVSNGDQDGVVWSQDSECGQRR